LLFYLLLFHPLLLQNQISTLQEELIAVRSDNAALKAQLETATTTSTAVQHENERLRAEATRLRWVAQCFHTLLRFA
jgi:regulator of replication initiation timing